MFCNVLIFNIRIGTTKNKRLLQDNCKGQPTDDNRDKSDHIIYVFPMTNFVDKYNINKVTPSL
uniref:Uncharacterized protein n=1 Tax=Anguilla anguilla TaxID=7936 RepID=A0A0E9PGM3_ANGAN